MNLLRLVSRRDPVPYHPLCDHRRSKLLTRLGPRLSNVVLECRELLWVQLGDRGVGLLRRVRVREGGRRSLLITRRHGGKEWRESVITM